jgi:hypothetical protein
VAVEQTVKGSVEVVDIETIDLDDTEYAPFIKIFYSFGLHALPVVTVNGEPASFGTQEPGEIVASIKRALPSLN